jgi:membrane protein
MPASMKLPRIARARRAIQASARHAWSADRGRMTRFAALRNQALRIVVMVARGIIAHRVMLLAAALTYYTVFAIVPTLAVVLSIMRMLDYLPAIAPDVPSGTQSPDGNDLFHVALRRILEAVNRTNELGTGLLGVGVLLVAISKMFRQTARALHIIAASGQKKAPRFSRLLGYLALVFIPPAALALSGIFFALFNGPLLNKVVRPVASIAGVDLSLGTALVLLTLWLAVAVFYWSAVRARIPFRSAAAGAAVAAVALPVVFWAFASLQVGVSHASALGSGLLAVPVFLLWLFSSWTAVLVGAEIAVAHRADRVLLHGVAAFTLDGLGERQACTSIMVCVTRAAAAMPGGGAVVTEDELARTHRLPLHVVRALCQRLVRRGLLAEQLPGYILACDPARTELGTVIAAVDRDPDLEAAHAEGFARLSPGVWAALSGPSVSAPGSGPSLARLAEETP